MPRRYPAEVRRQVIELARSGTKVAQLAVTFGMSDATIYNWLKQERIDRGEVAGLSTDQAARARRREAPDQAARDRAGRLAEGQRGLPRGGPRPQKALPGDRVPDRAGHQRPSRLPRARRLGVRLLRLEGPARPAADAATDLAGRRDRRCPQGLRRHLRRDAGDRRAALRPRRSWSVTTRSSRSCASSGSRGFRPGGCPRALGSRRSRRSTSSAARSGVTRPNELWMTDITEHPTREGKVYCCVVLDAFSRLVVGWSIDSTQTTVLVLNALGMATQRRDRADGLVIHSDRGVQFTSWAFSQKVRDAGLAPSMGAVGSAYDNAMVESLLGADAGRAASTADAGRPGSSSPPRSTTTSSSSTTPGAVTRRSGCSPRPNTRTYTTRPNRPPDSRTATPEKRGKITLSQRVAA